MKFNCNKKNHWTEKMNKNRGWLFSKEKTRGRDVYSRIRIPDLWNGKSFAQVRYRNDAISRISIVGIHNDKIEWSSSFWKSNF